MAIGSIRGIVKDVIIIAVCVAVIWIGLTAYFGAQNPFYVVSSGSMYPELAMHDIIVISGHMPFEDVKIGNIIVFDRPKDHDKVIVHRVVAVVDDNPKTLRTKGDNNQHSIVGTDYPITKDEYIGTVVHVIPQVGFITKILQPPINYIIIAVIIGIMVIRQIYKKEKKELLDHMDQANPESSMNDYNEFQSNEKIEQSTKDFDSIYSAQEKKPTDKLDEKNTKSEDTPEFFLDKEKESEENK